MNVLDKIVAQKHKEVQENRVLQPIELLEKSVYFNSPTISLSEYVKRSDKSGVIAEFKRKSPSKPEINLYADVATVTTGYMRAGASALSVLTDQLFFGGSNAHLTTARKYNFCPILRKDFIIDEYQIIEAKSIGADAVLLICEILTKEEVAKLAKFAKQLNLEVLLELHSEEQLDKYTPDCQLIGVNNRNLDTFNVSLDFSKNLFEKLPKEAVKITESGIKSAQEASILKGYGYDGYLIGENFMKTADPGLAAAEFISSLN